MKVRFLRDKEGKVDQNYVIAEDGSYIRDKWLEEKLEIYVNGDGYRVISIEVNGENYHHIKICQLQWLAWKGIISKGFVIHHIDENKENDHKDNLDCMLKSEHAKHHKTGNKNMLGKHHTEESNQKNRESNTGLQAGEKNPMFGVQRFGEKNPNVKITDSQVEEIKILGYIKHLKQKDIAKKYDRSKGCINSILQGHSRNPDHLPKSELIRQIEELFKKRKS